MAGFGLRKNMVFEWKGSTFRIDRLQPNGEILLESINGGALTLVTRQELLDDFTQGLVRARDPAESVDAVKPSYSRPLEDLSDEVKKEIKRRRLYLEAITAEGKPVFTPEYLLTFIHKVAKELDDAKPPSVTTVYRWYRRFIQNSDTRALIPRYDLRGSKTRRQSPRLAELLAEAAVEASNRSKRLFAAFEQG